MNTVDFSRENSSFLSPQSSTSRISSKAQKEAYNAFLVSEGGNGNSVNSEKGDFQNYSLSNHFSGDSAEGNALPVKISKDALENFDPKAIGGLSFSSIALFSGSNLIAQGQSEVADLNQGMLAYQSNMQPKGQQVVAENNSTVLSQGKVVLPEGLQSVAPGKTQVIVNQLVLGAVLKNGILDASKTESMYRPATSADLASSKKGFSESTTDVRGVLRQETAQAVTATGQSDQRQHEGDSGKKDSHDQQHKAHTNILNQADIQTRIDPASLALAEQQNSSAGTATLKTMEELNPVIMEHMDRLLKNQQKHLKVKLELPDGEILSLQLKLDDGAVHVNFESGSEELLNSLAEGWGALEDAAQQRGVVIAKPQFETSSTVEGALYFVADNYSASASPKL